MMQLKQGAEVYTADGEKVGSVDRIVIEPDTKEVTHLVVEKGFLFREDKVLPMSLVGPATKDRVTLREDADDLDRLPDFQAAHYVRADRDTQLTSVSEHQAPPVYWYPPLGFWNEAGGYLGYSGPNYVLKTEQNTPEDTVALEKGARVIANDGQHIGDIERIFTEPDTDRATHLLISEGLLLKKKTLVPTKWISIIMKDTVHLSVDSDLVESLPKYPPRG
jgi:uncharacterized protein YrrD